MFGAKKKTDTDAPADAEAAPKKKRMTKAQKLAMEQEALAIEGKSVTPAVEEAAPVKKARKPRVTKKAAKEAEQLAQSTDIGEPRKMYVMKFNTPILPYAKFPLTQNKYIQDFLK